jgi:hypothetical protein
MGFGISREFDLSATRFVDISAYLNADLLDFTLSQRLGIRQDIAAAVDKLLGY